MSGAEVSFSTLRARVTPATNAGEIYTKPSSFNSPAAQTQTCGTDCADPFHWHCLCCAAYFFKNATIQNETGYIKSHPRQIAHERVLIAAMPSRQKKL